MRLLSAVLAAALAAPLHAADTTAPAADAAPTTEAAPAAAPATTARNDGDVKVCRMVREIGSNRASRVCRTKAQIEAESETARSRMNGPQGDKSF